MEKQGMVERKKQRIAATVTQSSSLDCQRLIFVVPWRAQIPV